jgi:concentrative nucleoside transporter, CNT family
MFEQNLSLEGVLRAILGIAVMIGLSWLFSTNRKRVNWRLVRSGVLIQLVIAIAVFKVPFVTTFFNLLAKGFATLTDFTLAGSKLLFGGLMDTESIGFLFAFQVLPTIIFFSALSGLLYYYGILQKVVYGIAWVMNKTMRLSGAESLSAAANIFVGQTEAPLAVKPFIPTMTKSEIMCLMTGGMATIAGGVLASFIGLLGGLDPVMRLEFAKHLLTASVLSAPAAIVCSKILVPETEEIDQNLKIHKGDKEVNALEAVANGTSTGLKLAVNVGAMLLVFTAFVAMFNGLGNYIGEASGLNGVINSATNGRYDSLSLQMVFGYAFSPLAWIMGIAKEDMLIAGQLLGEKTILNEYFAYTSFSGLKNSGAFANPKSMLILTYALCGFSNIASIGIQIGGISTLAPNKKSTLAKLGFRALIGGTLACLMTGTIVGMFY